MTRTGEAWIFYDHGGNEIARQQGSDPLDVSKLPQKCHTVRWSVAVTGATTATITTDKALLVRDTVEPWSLERIDYTPAEDGEPAYDRYHQSLIEVREGRRLLGWQVLGAVPAIDEGNHGEAAGALAAIKERRC